MNRAVTIALAAWAAIFLTEADALCVRQGKAASQWAVTASSDEPPTLVRSVHLSGLDEPWDLTFTPDRAMLFTERCRGLSVRRSNGTIQRLFGSDGAAVVADDFFCRGQSGMLGVAIDPRFAENRLIYVYMSSVRGWVKTNRVVRLVVDAGYITVRDRTDIVADIPYKDSASLWGGAGAHSGGRLRFSTLDGYLYVTTGDNHEGLLPQDLKRLGGKVLRIDLDGTGAPENNAPVGADPRIFTYGHRNVQGIAFRPGSGHPFACEHGPGHSDEVTPLTAGGNGGWEPRPEPQVSCLHGYCGYTSNKRDGTPTPMTDLAKFPQALRPSWNNDGRSEGMGPCVFLSGAHWQAWDGQLAVGFLRGGRIVMLQMDAAGRTIGTTAISGIPTARIRALVQGPDGALYVAVDSGEVWRLAPGPS